MVEADAGEGQLAAAFAGQAAIAFEHEIALPVVLGVVHQHQVRIAARLARQAGEVVVAPDVAVDRDERSVTQQGQGVQHAAAGFQWHRAFVAVVQAQAPARTVAEQFRKAWSQPGGVDHHLGDAQRGQLFQVPGDQRLAAHFEQGFGGGVGERAHALAQAGGEDQGAHFNRPAAR